MAPPLPPTGSTDADPSRAAARAVVAANLRAAAADLEVARAEGDDASARFLGALLDADADLVTYHAAHRHYALVFGDLTRADHVAVVVPGVGGEATMAADWIPWAQNLQAATRATAVVLWKGYDDPPDVLDAAVAVVSGADEVATGAERLRDFLVELDVAPAQTLTLVAHSFGTTVVGAALAAYELGCTDVVVLGSPGTTVDDVTALNVAPGHVFAEKAPEDLVAGLGAVGTDPASLAFGAIRLTTNEPGRPEVLEHSSYFTRGSAALENIANVVTGRYAQLRTEPALLSSGIGNLVTAMVKAPVAPLHVFVVRYEGPGFRVLLVVDHGVQLVATQIGALARDAVSLLVANRTVGDALRQIAAAAMRPVPGAPNR